MFSMLIVAVAAVLVGLGAGGIYQYRAAPVSVPPVAETDAERSSRESLLYVSIAAVCVGDDREGTLKRVLFENGGARVRLRASNPIFKDVIVPAERVHFAGLLKGVMRHVGSRK